MGSNRTDYTRERHSYRNDLDAWVKTRIKPAEFENLKDLAETATLRYKIPVRYDILDKRLGGEERLSGPTLPDYLQKSLLCLIDGKKGKGSVITDSEIDEYYALASTLCEQLGKKQNKYLGLDSKLVESLKTEAKEALAEHMAGQSLHSAHALHQSGETGIITVSKASLQQLKRDLIQQVEDEANARKQGIEVAFQRFYEYAL